MTEETFASLIHQIQTLKVPRVRIVGNGEATLHPKFNSMVRELAHACKYLQLVTNLQRIDDSIIAAMLESPIRLVEISVDSDHKEGYERSRILGDFDSLLENLSALKAARNRSRADILINIRVMIGPTELPRASKIVNFWRPYADTVMTQNLVSVIPGASDVFEHAQRLNGTYPKCALTLTTMDVHWNGNVPLCNMSGVQTGLREGLIVGNINSDTLENIWLSPVFEQYRQAHRKRSEAAMPICKGCIGT